MMNNPMPIDTAPTDGTPILTEHGVVCNDISPHYQHPRWIRCTPSGDHIEPADSGSMWFGSLPYYVDPKVWVPLPDWMK